MSERTEIPPLDIVAFIVAMIGGPVMVTMLTFWLALIPVYAVVIGGIPYLVIGTPMALWMALRGPITVERALQWSGLTILVLTGAIAVFTAFTTEGEAFAATLMIGGVCAVFGMAWAGTTGWIYVAMTREEKV
jgi:hypothetical protein